MEIGYPTTKVPEEEEFNSDSDGSTYFTRDHYMD